MSLQSRDCAILFTLTLAGASEQTTRSKAQSQQNSYRSDFMKTTSPVHTQKPSRVLTSAIALGIILSLAGTSQAQTENVLYSFTGGRDGGDPAGGLVRDAAGNLYGTTVSGGLGSNGVVFQLHPESSGGWTQTLLHVFQSGKDGGTPSGGVVLDAAGNVYGGVMIR